MLPANGKKDAIVIRHPSEHDAVAVWRLVQNSTTLDHNSFYCYYVQFRHFPRTCSVAELDGRIVGFVTAHIPNTLPDTVFVWQIRVLEEVRGHGVGSELLAAVVRSAREMGARYVEATISPTNKASRSLFAALARRLDVPFQQQPLLEPEMFPADAGVHDPEHLFRIGPIT